MGDDIAARRAKLMGVQGGASPEMLSMLTEAQRNNAELHSVIAEMGQTVRAYAKDINQYIRDDDKEDTSREDAHRAEVAAINAQLLKATADWARCEGELAALRMAYADMKAMCDSLMADETAESAPRVLRFEVQKDNAGNTRGLVPIYDTEQS